MQAKVAEFLSLVGNTIVSYLSTYGTDAPEETSDDAQFVLSLCGTVTSELPASFLSLSLSLSHFVQQLEPHFMQRQSVDCLKYQLLPLDIAASAFGRDYLATSDEGKVLLETLCNVLASNPLVPQW